MPKSKNSIMIAKATLLLAKKYCRPYYLRELEGEIDAALKILGHENALRVYEVYEEGDTILPTLEIPNPCSIRIEITNDHVVLFVGQRDWQWSRKTGIISGAGTEITSVEDETKS
jgi:hypothetical protein